MSKIMWQGEIDVDIKGARVQGRVVLCQDYTGGYSLTRGSYALVRGFTCTDREERLLAAAITAATAAGAVSPWAPRLPAGANEASPEQACRALAAHVPGARLWICEDPEIWGVAGPKDSDGDNWFVTVRIGRDPKPLRVDWAVKPKTNSPYNQDWVREHVAGLLRGMGIETITPAHCTTTRATIDCDATGVLTPGSL